MAYDKQTWANGDVITAEKLNHMEDGIGGVAIEPLSITITHDDDAGTCSANKTYSNFRQEWLEALDQLESCTDLYKTNVPCIITYVEESEGEQTSTDVYDGIVTSGPLLDSNDGTLALITYITNAVTYSEESVYEYRSYPNGFLFYQKQADDIVIGLSE